MTLLAALRPARLVGPGPLEARQDAGDDALLDPVRDKIDERLGERL